MSLLLDALKKAEKAKEAAQLRGESMAPPKASLDFADEPEGAAPDRPVLTRENLPDISQPLEILSDHLERPAPARASGAPGSAGGSAAPAPKYSRASPNSGRAAAEAAGRASARKVFEAKFSEPDPRRSFFITLGVLGVFAVGTVVYFWIQLRPPPPLVNANPKPPAHEAPIAIAQASVTSAPVVNTAASAARAEPAGAQRSVVTPPSTPGRSTASRPPQASRSAPVPGTAATTLPRAASRPVLRAVPAPAAADPGMQISFPRTSARIHPQVEAGYAAYQAGDLAAARTAYRLALRDEPANRDALLGLAAIDLRTQRPEAAESFYRKILQADPHDAHAHAGLLALLSGTADPLHTESRLKNMLASDAGGHVLQFTLGNQYARQQRWAEAAQAYTKALAADPESPDIAYNLAVSLDRLHKPALALQYYHRALAGGRGAAFDRASAERRVQELAR